MLRDQGDLQGARTLYERALSIREAGLGADHPDTAESRKRLAAVVAELDKQPQVLPIPPLSNPTVSTPADLRFRARGRGGGAVGSGSLQEAMQQVQDGERQPADRPGSQWLSRRPIELHAGHGRMMPAADDTADGGRSAHNPR